MADPPDRPRVVYSTGAGRTCPKCGWPVADCRCSSRLATPDESVPSKITARLRVEKRGSGKVVTVIDGLPSNRSFLETLARELKKSCGTGGRVRDPFDDGNSFPSSVELQGDHRERLRELLGRRGWVVKG